MLIGFCGLRKVKPLGANTEIWVGARKNISVIAMTNPPKPLVGLGLGDSGHQYLCVWLVNQRNEVVLEEQME